MIPLVVQICCTIAGLHESQSSYVWSITKVERLMCNMLPVTQHAGRDTRNILPVKCGRPRDKRERPRGERGG